jgi:hypothetical protein
MLSEVFSSSDWIGLAPIFIKAFEQISIFVVDDGILFSCKLVILLVKV